MQLRANIPGAGLAQIEINHDRIERVRSMGPPDDEKPFVTPGFIDIQLNGFAGVDFSSSQLEPEEAISVLAAIWSTGVASFCPTLITNSHGQLLRNLRVLEQARRADPRFAQAVPCYHLEGPYLSPGEASGVHDLKLMRSPNWDEFVRLQEAAGGRIGIVTLAPELPNALDLVRKAHESDVIVAIGHTDASPEQIHLAAEAGAELSTHLGNGCPQFIHRHRTPLWAQLALDQLKASLICDTFHLPPDLVKTIVRAKGIEKCILITDAIHVATLSPGRYTFAGTEVDLLSDGKVVKVGSWAMAGSALSMNRAVPIFKRLGDVSFEDAVQAATTNPANLLRRGVICSRLAEGQPANLVLFKFDERELAVEALIQTGTLVYVGRGITADTAHESPLACVDAPASAAKCAAFGISPS